MAGAEAATEALKHAEGIAVQPLQALHAGLEEGLAAAPAA